MTVFWIIAAALIVAALLFVLPTLLRGPEQAQEEVDRNKLTVAIYKDQLAELETDLRTDTITRDQYEQGIQELERRLLEDVPEDRAQSQRPAARPAARWVAYAVAIAVPLATVSLYMKWGNLEGLKPPGERTATANNPHGQSAEQIRALVAKLQKRLQKNPEDSNGWAILGRTYLVMERFPEARKAFANAVKLDGTNPQLLVDYADAMAMDSKDKSLQGRPLELINRALMIDPNNQKGLWLAGTAAYDGGKYEKALKYWQKLYTMVPPNSDAAKAMESNIAEIQNLIAKTGGGAGEAAKADDKAGVQADGSSSSEAVAAAAPVSAVVAGRVTLSPDLKARANPDDVVYIFARAPPGGPQIPLATIKTKVKNLPMSFSMDDSMAIVRSAKLSDFSHTVVGARVSKSGDAMAHSGDLQGMSDVVAVGDKNVKVVINKIVP